jgi:hypothetical protein
MFFDLRKIQHIPKLVEDSLVDRIYNNAKLAPKTNATVGKIINGKYTTDYNEWCTADFVDYSQFENDVKTLVPYIVCLIEDLYKVKCINDPEINFLSYKSGAYYKTHIDGQYIEEGIAKRGVDRDITAVFYLNDDYEGGLINFDFFDLTIKPKTNDLLIYPTTFQYQHNVSKVVGNRYAIVFWFTTNPHINVDIPIPKHILKQI